MRDLLIRLLVNTVAIYVAVSLLPGLDFDRGPVRFLAVAALFGIVNSLLRPVLAVLTCPLVLLTLGLFTIVINAVLLQFTAWLSAQLGLGFHVARGQLLVCRLGCVGDFVREHTLVDVRGRTAEGRCANTVVGGVNHVSAAGGSLS
jgi:putative membrane protein